MKLFIKHNLKKAGKQLSPDPMFKAALWTNLAKVWDTETSRPVLWYQQVWFRYAVVVLVGLAVVTVGATGTYAYSSPEVTVGTPLYPIKEKLEQVEARLQKSPQAKTAFLLKTIDRREAEKKVLEKNRKPVEKVNMAITRVEEKLEVASVALKEDRKKNPVLLQKVEKRLEQRKERLEQAAARLKILLTEREQKREERIEKRTEVVSSTKKRQEEKRRLKVVPEVKEPETVVTSTVKNLRGLFRE